jgi:hypothetical protein
MNVDTIENPGITMESNTENAENAENAENTDFTRRSLDRVEHYLISIRAACWLAAIGIFALVVTQVV